MLKRVITLIALGLMVAAPALANEKKPATNAPTITYVPGPNGTVCKTVKTPSGTLISGCVKIVVKTVSK